MKRSTLALILGLAVVAALLILRPDIRSLAQLDIPFFEREPDIPAMLANSKALISKEEFLIERANAFGIMRGLGNDDAVDPQARTEALKEIEKQSSDVARLPESSFKEAVTANWTAIGPAPIIVGTARFSGRVTAIAVHPTNPDIVYVGAAQGGVYRSTNGGTSWVPLMESAQSLAVGSIAIAPSDPEIVYVGTGEPNFSADSFFGVGIYRINNASTTADLTGPLNRNSLGADIFTGRSISEIIVHPTDPATIFASSTSGIGGIGGATISGAPSRGVYRSMNATSADPIFTKLTGLMNDANASVRDIIIDPGDPNVLVAGVLSAGPNGGIYRTDNALSVSPTFVQTQSYVGTTTSELTTEFAAVRPPGSDVAIFYAATGNLGGRVLRSTDGGLTWVQRVDNDFCNPQCFYNIAVAVDPVNPDLVYLGGAPTLVSAFSTDGGQSFTDGGFTSGVHVDTQALAVSPSNPMIVYLGTDGGIYRSTNSGASYTHLNTAQFSATQFMGLSVHPTDPNFTIGGTQDNGTLFYDSAATSWTRIDGGDGGYSVIDQNAPDLTNVRMYHTRFSRLNSTVGYRTRGTTTSEYTFRGCANGTTPNNGINCNDTAVLFYAPLESGPGNPNTVYYGTDRLYRTSDLGVTHTVASQAPIQSGVAISAIGISPQNDNIRIVGLRNGGLFGTNTGGSTLTDLDSTNVIPSGFVARAAIDPTNSATAYVTLAAFGVNNVFKTTDLDAAAPTWTNISGTIPLVPVSAFLVDPQNSNILYAGTDIGVYVSADAGLTWNPFGTGLPRSAVFDIAKTAGNMIRIATHGRGMWQIPAFSPTAIPVSISGRVTTPTGLGLRNAIVTLTDDQGVRQVATTSSFGLYSFDSIAPGATYVIGVSSKRYRFTPQTVNVTSAMANLDFLGQE